MSVNKPETETLCTYRHGSHACLLRGSISRLWDYYWTIGKENESDWELETKMGTEAEVRVIMHPWLPDT
jgi:hypothetical protein